MVGVAEGSRRGSGSIVVSECSFDPYDDGLEDFVAHRGRQKQVLKKKETGKGHQRSKTSPEFQIHQQKLRQKKQSKDGNPRHSRTDSLGQRSQHRDIVREVVLPPRLLPPRSDRPTRSQQNSRQRSSSVASSSDQRRPTRGRTSSFDLNSYHSAEGQEMTSSTAENSSMRGRASSRGDIGSGQNSGKGLPSSREPSPAKTLSTWASAHETMTFGSTVDGDSFVVTSTTGFSETEESASSHSFNPYGDGDAYQRRAIEKRRLRTAQSSANKHDGVHEQDPFFDNTPEDNFGFTVLKRGNPNILAKNMTRASATMTSRLPRISIYKSRTELRRGFSSDGSSGDAIPSDQTIPTAKTTLQPVSKSETNSTPLFGKQDSERSSSTEMDTRRRSRAARVRRGAASERDYWKARLASAHANHGQRHIRTAEVLTNLGNAHLRCREYNEALSVYKSAVRVLRGLLGDSHLSVGRALDRVGFAASKCLNNNEDLDWAMVALNEAFHIRYNALGPHHPDVVDTLNSIAGVHLHRGDLKEALDAYSQVIRVRAEVFGRCHPSVAVTAHSVGLVHMRMSNMEQAIKYYDLALRIYRGESMKLKKSNPLVAKVAHDRASAERILALSMGFR